MPSVIAIDGPLLPKVPPMIFVATLNSFSFAPRFITVADPDLVIWRGIPAQTGFRGCLHQFSPILAPFVLRNGGGVYREGPIVEAFPNAFLGVLMPEVELLAAPRFKRGRRFDWLYEQMVTTGRLESGAVRNLDLPDVVWHRLRSETDHELRAALICLLTAALASKGTTAIIGEAEGGWFWLPPWSLWEPWATRGLESAAKKDGLSVGFRSGPTTPL